MQALGFLLVAVLLGCAVYFLRLRWGAAPAKYVGILGGCLLFGSLVFAPFNPPGNDPERSTRYVYIGITNAQVLQDALTFVKLSDAPPSDGSKPASRKTVFLIRPEGQSLFDAMSRAGQLPGVASRVVRPTTDLGRREGLTFAEMLSHLSDNIARSIAPDADVFFIYPRSPSGVQDDAAVLLTPLRSRYAFHARILTNQTQLGTAASYIPPVLRLDEPPADLSPTETTVPIGAIQIQGSTRNLLRVATYEPKAASQGYDVVVKPLQAAGAAGGRTFAEGAPVEAGKVPDTGEFENGRAEYNVAGPEDTSGDSRTTKTVEFRLLNTFQVNGTTEKTETVSLTTHVLKRREIPAAFLGGSNQPSLLFRALKNRGLAYSLDLQLTPADAQADRRKLITRAPSFIALDGANKLSVDRIKQLFELCKQPDIPAPAILLIDPADEWLPFLQAAGVEPLKKSAATPRLVVPRLDQSGSLEAISKVVIGLIGGLADRFKTRALDGKVPMPGRQYSELKYVLEDYWNDPRKASISDLVVVYDPSDVDNDNDWQPIAYIKPFLDANPRTRLVLIAGEHPHPPDVAALASPDRLLLYPGYLAAPNQTPQLIEWLTAEVMPRLTIIPDDQGGLASLPCSPTKQAAFGDFVTRKGGKALINALCDFKPLDDWKHDLARDHIQPLLWTEHWDRLATGKPRSPFFVKLPALKMGGGQEVDAYQICAELNSNITDAGSPKQRDQLANILTRAFECASPFSAQHPLQAEVTASEVRAWKTNSAPFSLRLCSEDDARTPWGMAARLRKGDFLFGGYDASHDTRPAAGKITVRQNINRLESPRLFFNEPASEPRVLEFFVQDTDEIFGRLQILVTVPEASAAVMQASAMPPNPAPVHLVAQERRALPGRLLPAFFVLFAAAACFWILRG